MIKELVVIATHGGVDLLKESLPKFGNRPVAVVETGCKTPEVYELTKQYPNVLYLSTPYKGYDTGAYLWAYWMIEAEEYLFLQDSVSPREADYFEQFAKKMPGKIGAVGWSSFGLHIWDSGLQYEATQFMYGSKDVWPEKGIFGPIFYTTRESLKLMDDSGLLPSYPVHKQGQQAMERAWAILFHRAGLLVNFLVDEDTPRGAYMSQGGYPALNKVFRHRV